MSTSKPAGPHFCQLDNRTAPTWQSFANNQTGMANAFRDAMAKLAIVGQNTSNMTDCSWVVPTPKNLSSLPV
jgi:cytochrome c peroxidase